MSKHGKKKNARCKECKNVLRNTKYREKRDNGSYMYVIIPYCPVCYANSEREKKEEAENGVRELSVKETWTPEQEKLLDHYRGYLGIAVADMIEKEIRESERKE